MTEQEAIDKVVRLLHLRRFDCGHRMTLYVHEKKLILVPRSSSPGGALEIAHITPQDLQEGLRSASWFVIEAVIRFLIKEKKL